MKVEHTRISPAADSATHIGAALEATANQEEPAA